MFSLPVANWIRLFVWLFIGLVIYFSYGIRHSRITRNARAASGTVTLGQK
jgi:APA family basic amino acid/polyamine antiporter